MRKVAYIGVKFDENEEIREFNLNLPATTEILSSRRLLKAKYNFLQLCYAYHVESLEEEIIDSWKSFKFFIISTTVTDFDTSNLKHINDIKVNSNEFKVYYTTN